jgi:hypothetical protein
VLGASSKRGCPCVFQLVNKFWYTKEGAKAFLDQSCADLPWELTVELDGRVVDIPEVLPPKGKNLKGEPCVISHLKNFLELDIS